jgi:hypothetical protein
VNLPIEEYEEMMEDLEMGRAARESKGQPRRPFEDVVKELRAAGEIDVYGRNSSPQRLLRVTGQK